MAKGRNSAELLVRTLSGLFLAATALFLTFYSVHSFAIMIMVFVSAMAWEWGRLVRGDGLDIAFGVQLAATVAASFAAMQGWPGTALMAVAIGTVAVFCVRIVRDVRPQAWWSAAGVYYCGLPAVALIWFRTDAVYGIAAILYLFAIVWTTDSAAYLFGRTIGGPKLAPSVSPKKTWSGLMGGAFSAGLVGLAFPLVAGTGLGLRLSLMAVGLAVIAQLGDLGESAVKRIFGMKDTSGLIPGHGGVLDRVDGLLFAAAAAALLAWLIDPANPGRALLVGH
jgi:phosphatidate cytidylyltransferase